MRNETALKIRRKLTSSRISRKDLYGSDSEPEPVELDGPVYIPDLVFEDVEVASEPEETVKDTSNDEEMAEESAAEDEGFAFNLFSGGGATADAPAKVVITKDPTPEDAPPAPVEGVLYVEMHRPDSYYFSHPTSEQILNFTQTAVSGESILEHSQLPQPRFLGTSTQGGKLIDYTALQEQAKRDYQRLRNKKRPGKKARAVRKQKTAAMNEIKRARQAAIKKQQGFRAKQAGPKAYAPPKTKGGHPRKQPKVRPTA